MAQKTLITGASGFVGRALCTDLVAHGFDVVGTVRSLSTAPVSRVDYRTVGELGVSTDWSNALAGVQVVVHLAAAVHVMRDTAADLLAAFRNVNTVGTETLARAAARTGVKRFVFLGSIKVNGEETGAIPFSEQNAPDPPTVNPSLEMTLPNALGWFSMLSIHGMP